MPDKQTPDGGLIALAGYLYQTVGVLGMKAGAFHLENLIGSSDLEALLILAEQNELRYEYLDQDAAIRHSLALDDKDTFVLVQFKFSRQFPIPKITQSEFKKIMSRLRTSTRRARDSGQQVSGYVLVSNRELGAECQKMLDDAQNTNLDQQSRAILRKLHVLSHIPKEAWEDALKQFARTYGCVDNDIRKGIDELIGNIINRTVNTGSPSITQENLIEAFTGYAGSRPLTPDSVASQSQIRLDEFFAEHHLKEKRVLVRRSVLDAISRLSDEHAIVILYGLGGNGKTVSLWHWTEEFLSSSTPQQEGTYIAITAAEDVRPNLLTHLSCDWAKLPAHHARRAENLPEHVLERLYVASPTAKHPILYLGIDAIDEEQYLTESTHRTAIKELLVWFWKEEREIRRLGGLPRATIILTCRSEEEIENRWLNLLSPFGDANERLPNVAINDFSALELLEAARLGLSEELSARIEESLASVETNFPYLLESPEAPLLQRTNPFLPAVDQQVLQALHHPALWRCLLTLDEALQCLVLDGDRQAVQQLAEIYVGWFCSKAEKRGHALTSVELNAILTTIGHKCQQGELDYKRMQWIDWACSTQLIAVVGAGRLYNEAISAGLIEKTERETWHWRHAFIGDYLKANALI